MLAKVMLQDGRKIFLWSCHPLDVEKATPKIVSYL